MVGVIHCVRLQECPSGNGCYSPHAPYPSRSLLSPPLSVDIKSDNILINSKGEVKLSDFGFATVVTSMNAERTSKVGTPFWMSPELIQGESYTNKVDVWSLGITALEMADGEPPHFHDPPLKAMRMIHSGPSPTLRQPHNWSTSFVDFLSKALDVNVGVEREYEVVGETSHCRVVALSSLYSVCVQFNRVHSSGKTAS